MLPRDDFDAAMTDRHKLSDFVHLKGNWGMSAAAIIYRAAELDYVDDARFRALQIQMSKWRRNEPGRSEPVVGALLPRLIEVNGGSSNVVSRLGVNPKHLQQLKN